MGVEFEPGDLAIVNGVRAFNVDAEDPRPWINAAGVRMWGDISEPRPLVVIDPEDRETLAKFAAWTADGDYAEWRIDWVQNFLRSLITPPKPEEPTDPKAQVEDRRENIWRLLADGDWICTSGPDCGEYLAWSGLAERGPLTITVEVTS